MLAGLALQFNATKSVNRSELQSSLQASTLLPSGFKTWPDIQLTDQHGESVKAKNDTGKWQIVFFGYTHCPDICPMTLTVMSNVVKKLESDYSSDFLQTVFISVDPERDTPEHLSKYMAFFNPAFLGLSPNQSELKTFTKDLSIIYKRVENPDNPANYLMDHSASLMLFDADGNAIAVFSMPHETDKVAADLIALHSALGTNQ